MEPTHKSDLTASERKGALQYLMFVKEKRCGTIKGHGCTNGRTQQPYIAKEETSSPTVSTEALMLIYIVNAEEKRDVAIVDLPGAFMQSDMEGKVIMKLEGVMAEVIVKINPPKYEKCIVQENGKDVIYVILAKALYSTLQTALIFWQNLLKQLQKWGFTINPYNFCVANKIIKGRQCAVAWHIDNLKILHVDTKVVTTVVNLLDNVYGQQIVDGKRAAITIQRGKVHKYLGMTLNYTESGVVKIDMCNYVKKIYDEMPEDMNGTATSPAADHLFEVIDSIELLPQTESEFFHATVEKLLFLCKRGRSDIQTAVAFLCTRVRQSTRHDYNKLSCTIKYLHGSAGLVLRLSANNLNVIKWWVDASYAVHCNMRSHTGGAMSMGAGAIYSTSKEQKLNTKSSAEAELVRIDDVLPQALWPKYFMEPQGYGVSTVLAQDNQSTMRLTENGKASSGRGTRHINIRIFFNTDCIASKEITIQYCPTKDMVADYFTKPLQGVLFYKFRDQIIGVVPMDTIVGDHRSVLDPKLERSLGSSKRSKIVSKSDTNTSLDPGSDVRSIPGHKTWADIVKSKLLNRTKHRRHPLLKQ